MNNIRNATCKLDGIAESVFLASGQISERLWRRSFVSVIPFIIPDRRRTEH